MYDAGLARLAEADLTIRRQSERLEPVARFRIEPGGIMKAGNRAGPEVTERDDVRRHVEHRITKMRRVSFMVEFVLLARPACWLVGGNQPLDDDDVAPVPVEVAVAFVDADLTKPGGAAERAARCIVREHP